MTWSAYAVDPAHMIHAAGLDTEDWGESRRLRFALGFTVGLGWGFMLGLVLGLL